MSKTHEYFQQELGLDKKTSEAIKILMDEGLLEPLLVDLRNSLEAEEHQKWEKEEDDRTWQTHDGHGNHGQSAGRI